MSTTEKYLNAIAVRRTTSTLVNKILNGEGYFNVDLAKLESASDFVVDVIKTKYPDLKIPYHSRWGHFKAGNENRLGQFLDQVSSFDKMEQARIQFDLVIPSVLLDAGAGKVWKFTETNGFSIGRSEGLGIASFYMFLDGGFSSNDSRSLLSDSAGLKSVDSASVGRYFQVTKDNPLVGLEGRAQLVRDLGFAVKNNPQYFIGDRVGGLVDYLLKTYGLTIKASDILLTILSSMGSIWPGRIEDDGINLGDAWRHSTSSEYIVLHKLSQWLSYSLFEPLEMAGFKIIDADSMTGLAEYRNGGLFYDLEVIQLKDKTLLEIEHEPSSDLIIEWRALTVQLLDRIAPLVRSKVGLSAEEFPLAKILEGGTWWAGRKIAAEKRADATPPIKIKSDGTVF